MLNYYKIGSEGNYSSIYTGYSYFLWNDPFISITQIKKQSFLDFIAIMLTNKNFNACELFSIKIGNNDEYRFYVNSYSKLILKIIPNNLLLKIKFILVNIINNQDEYILGNHLDCAQIRDDVMNLIKKYD